MDNESFENFNMPENTQQQAGLWVVRTAGELSKIPISGIKVRIELSRDFYFAALKALKRHSPNLYFDEMTQINGEFCGKDMFKIQGVTFIKGNE